MITEEMQAAIEYAMSDLGCTYAEAQHVIAKFLCGVDEFVYGDDSDVFDGE